MNASQARPVIDPQNPWPGLLSFPEEAEQFFNGRDTERDELVRLIRRDTLTLLYGQSGLGKSSLLLAGVFPLLRQEHFLPVHVRLDHAETSPAHDRQLRETLLDACTRHGVTPPAAPEPEGTWELLHRSRGFWDAKRYPVIPVLVIDQFEEIFTLGASNPARLARSRAFIAQLGDLIDNHPPQALLDRLADTPDAAEQFAFSKPGYRIVLSLREDYLADLRQLREHTSSSMQNELRLKLMDGDHALEAVATTGGALVEPGAAEAIVRAVARAQGTGSKDVEQPASAADGPELKTLEVEPALLSMVCSELNERRKADKLPTISADLLKSSRDEILESFYNRGFTGLSPAVRVFVEERLLTDSGFHRNFAALDDANRIPGVTEGEINTLVTRRLLRVEDRFGTKRVELTHDVLTDPARVSRDRRRAQERRRAEQAAQAAHRRRQLVAGATLVLIILGVSSVLFVWSRAWASVARERQRESERLSAIAITAKAEAQVAVANAARLDARAKALFQTVQEKEEAIRDSADQLSTQREQLERERTATQTAQTEALQSRQASRVGAEAAQVYRGMTGMLLERRTATTASIDSLQASLKRQREIQQEAQATREEGLARARLLEAAFCGATRGNTAQRDSVDKMLTQAGTPLSCPGDRPERGNRS